MRLLRIMQSGRLTLEVLCTEFPWMMWWADRASPQWSCYQYLSWKEKLLLFHQSDHPCHGHWNGAIKGLKASGHEAAARGLIPMSNWSCGPYDKSQNVAKACGAALDFYATIGEGGLFLIYNFDDIKIEKNLPDTSRASRRAHLEKEREGARKHRSKQGGPTPLTKGDMAKWNGWYNLRKGPREQDRAFVALLVDGTRVYADDSRRGVKVVRIMRSSRQER